MTTQEPPVGTIVRDRNGDPWIRRGEGPVWLSIDNHYRNWQALNDDFGPIEVATFPEATPRTTVTVHFAGGPWDGQTGEYGTVVGPVFAVGHPTGNHYWLDNKSDPPTYVWDGTEFEVRADG